MLVFWWWFYFFLGGGGGGGGGGGWSKVEGEVYCRLYHGVRYMQGSEYT